MNYYRFNPQIVVDENQQLKLKEVLTTSFSKEKALVLGFSKGRGITWFLDTNNLIKMNTVLRHYYRGGLFGKLVKDSYFFCGLENTRAIQEFNLLTKMVDWQLPVPKAVAVKVIRKGCFYSAEILIEKIENTQDLSQFLQNNRLSQQQYIEIGKIIKKLHRYQVHHSDLNIHNILFDQTKNQFWLIDFDKCQIQQGESWKQMNLERLLRSFNKEVVRLGIQFNQDDWQYLLKGYQN